MASWQTLPPLSTVARLYRAHHYLYRQAKTELERERERGLPATAAGKGGEDKCWGVTPYLKIGGGARGWMERELSGRASQWDEMTVSEC